MSWILVFIFSLVIDASAVVWTASVERKGFLWKAAGVSTTMLIATVNWLSVFLVVGEDHHLMIASVLGHAVGYLAGGRLADLFGSGTERPTTER